MAARFADRADAGRTLAAPLAALGLDRPLLVGLARGGVPIAAAAAAALVADGVGAEVDVGVARKITTADRPEAGLGAIAAEGEPVWFDLALESRGLTPEVLYAPLAAERAEVRRREQAYGARWRGRVPGRDTVLCDDGVATGMTVHAALRSIEAANPSRLVLAVPVAAPSALARLDEVWGGTVIALRAPEDFSAVGEAYADFGQLDDDDVMRALGR